MKPEMEFIMNSTLNAFSTEKIIAQYALPKSKKYDGKAYIDIFKPSTSADYFHLNKSVAHLNDIKFGTANVADVLKLSIGDEVALYSEDPQKSCGVIKILVINLDEVVFQFTPENKELKSQRLTIPYRTRTRFEGEGISSYLFRYSSCNDNGEAFLTLEYPKRFKEQAKEDLSALVKSSVLKHNPPLHTYWVSPGGTFVLPNKKGEIKVLEIKRRKLILELTTPTGRNEIVTVPLASGRMTDLAKSGLSGYEVGYFYPSSNLSRVKIKIRCSEMMKPSYTNSF